MKKQKKVIRKFQASMQKRLQKLVESKKGHQDISGEVADKDVLDAALINAAQAAEHYEITRYGSLIAWAKQLGRNDCASAFCRRRWTRRRRPTRN